ncbi:MAG: SIS domain-containing protein [Clostridiaceae bacterium]
MKEYTNNLIESFFLKWPNLQYLKENMRKSIALMTINILSGGKVLICGNGGSASDSEHIAGELLKEFYIKRPINYEFREKLIAAYGEEGRDMAGSLQGAIPAISLISQTGFLSAYGNDAKPELSFAQEVFAYGKPSDMLIAISTSGNAKNVCYAAMIAKSLDVFVLSLTGEDGGNLRKHSDVLLNVPEKETYLVQELHLPLYHLLCRGIEYEIFGEER